MKDFKTTTFELDGRPCALIAGLDPKYIIVQVTDAAEMAQQSNPLTAQAELIRDAVGPNFALAVFGVDDWNRDLSPWDAPAVFAGQPFGHGAVGTLEFLQSQFLPKVRAMLSAQPPVILAGYSLAGLFALWAAYQTDAFDGICAASPSVWFPGWLDYAKAAQPKTRCIYLSLGDKEEKTRNPVMSTVGDCIRAMAALLSTQAAPAIASTLEWNPGNHFKDPDKRLAKGCIWAIKSLGLTPES